MIPYIITFGFISLMAMMQPIDKPWSSLKIWIPMTIYLIIFVGLRHEVGSDWDNYLAMFNRDVPQMSYGDALVHGDPAFWLLMVWVTEMGWSIHIVNLVSGIFFVTGLVVFVRTMPNPWLALVVATGYTVLTLGMGYVRQGVALGLSLWAITALVDRKFVKFFILISFATAFHKSGVLMLGFGLFQGGRGKYLKAIAAVMMGIGIYMAFMSGNEEHYVETYIDSAMKSSGAYIRIFMNLIPALIFLYFRKRWYQLWPDSYTWWYLMALASLAAVPSVFILSTATDRVSLYLIPLQFVVFSSLPLLLQGVISPKVTTFLVVFYYGLVYFVWLNFAAWAFAWVPYQNILSDYFGYLY